MRNSFEYMETAEVKVFDENLMRRHSAANARQEGGIHYEADYQHWDWIYDVSLPYHPGNGTKYIARWRNKNGRQDLEKAIHYLDKTIELSDGPVTRDDDYANGKPLIYVELTMRFAKANELSLEETELLLLIANGRYRLAKQKLEEYMASVCPVIDATMPEVRKTKR